MPLQSEEESSKVDILECAEPRPEVLRLPRRHGEYSAFSVIFSGLSARTH
jgi:hypothetical protein